MSDEVKKLKQDHEDFVHIVAHDLSAPLRHVKDFTGLLMDSLAHDLTEEQLEYKKFIDTALSKLELMQSDLLTLSRLITRGNTFADVNIREVVQDAANEVGVNVTYSGGQETVWGDREQITLALQKLFDNAKLFARTDVSLQIMATVNQVTGGTEIAIRDNGIGIEEKYFTEIFKIFRRLHAFGEYGSGAGSGLTMVQKVMERHSGRVEVRSTIGQGSIFTLFFPQKD